LAGSDMASDVRILAKVAGQAGGVMKGLKAAT
jgi:hypothetical protein